MELTKTLAMYQDPASGHMMATAYYDGQNTFSTYVRVSEPLTVTFTALPPADVMAAAVSAIDAKIVEAQQAVRVLEQRKAELLALPSPESV